MEGRSRLDTSRWLPTRYISPSTICLKCEMCQSEARHTKARFETTIVGAMEQLGGYRAKSLSCPPILGPPKDIMTQLTQVGPTDAVKAPDYTGQLRYAKNCTFSYLGRTTLQVRQGPRSAVARAANASGAVGGS